jgi:signal transduction histidine kinase
LRPSLLITLAILVLAPLALLAWAGARAVREEREAVARKVHGLHASRLEEASLRLADLLARRAREIERAAEGLALEPGALRSWVRSLPFAGQAFLLGPDRKLLFPPPDGPPGEAEREFLERAAQLFRDRDRFFRQADSGPPAASGWYSWYWGSDVALARWQRLPSGSVLGVELNRARFIADAVAALPADESLPADVKADRIRLADSRGEVLHQWGAFDPGSARPAAALELGPPLAAWRLEYFSSGAALAATLGRGLSLQLVLGLSALGLVLAGLAVYFYRESTRDLREARRRVTFVNQVSHELKTPLTNIRLYADLIQRQLDGDGAVPTNDPKLHEYAEVIAGESQRLSRLIANILTFARRERRALRLRRRPGVVDESVAAVIERFRPALAAEGVEVRFAAGASGPAHLDPDALEQILDNLLGNVEKYAPRSGSVEISSRTDGTRTTIVVADRGPGIPERHREAVFEPFQRLSDRLNEGVSGTGLGLSIARELARLHGGDLRLVPPTTADNRRGPVGACFEVTLDTGPADGAQGEEPA